MKLAITPTCKEEVNRTIQVVEVTNATAPILYSMDGKNYTSKPDLNYLSVGTYEVSVRDHKNCKGSRLVAVTSKYCIAKHYEISYQYNAHWTIPIEEEGKVKIMARSGEIATEFNLSSSNETVWDGLNQRDEKLPNRFYTFIIIIQNKETFTGSISILE